MPTEALSCIVCNCRLENVFPTCENQPSDGVAFRSYGHYGSTVFDPSDGTFVEMNICDDCLKTKGEAGAVITARSNTPIMVEHMGTVGHVEFEPVYVPWRPDLPEYDDIDEFTFFDINTLPMPSKTVRYYHRTRDEVIAECTRIHNERCAEDESNPGGIEAAPRGSGADS